MARAAAALVLACCFVLLGPTGQAAGVPEVAAAVPTVTVKSFELGSEFKAPWQITWIPSGTPSGLIAFTDRTGNAVGLFDPATGKQQRIPLTVITNPGPITVIDSTRMAAAGTGGVAIFDRSGNGKITQLVMPNTRNQVLAMDVDSNLYLADAQQHDLRILEPPYSGPADITKVPLPAECRNPTGVVPSSDSTMYVLCQLTNNIVRIDSTGAVRSVTPLPVANAGGQEARPSPTGLVFSAFGANRFFSYAPSDASPFKSFALTGPAVPTVGLFYDPAADRKLRDAAAALRTGRKPTRSFFFNSFTPSFRTGSLALGSFPGPSSRAFDRLAGRNLVGSTNGPGGSIWIADATPGRPALHRVDVESGLRVGRTATGYRFSQWVTQATPTTVERMRIPYALPSAYELGASVTAASSSPWIGRRYYRNAALTAQGTLASGETYTATSKSAETGDFTRAYTFSIRPRTKSVTLTLKASGAIPASYKVDAVVDAPCQCDELTARVSDVSPVDAGTSGLRMNFRLNYGMNCFRGVGSKCIGTLELSPTTADRADGLRVSGNTTVTCRAECGEGVSDYARASLEGGSRFGTRALGKTVRVISLEIDRVCGGRRRTTVVDFVFGSDGKLDEKRSDYDGDGVQNSKDRG